MTSTPFFADGKSRGKAVTYLHGLLPHEEAGSDEVSAAVRAALRANARYASVDDRFVMAWQGSPPIT